MMTTLLQFFYSACNYAAFFLIVLVTKFQQLNNHLLKSCQYQGTEHRPPLWNRVVQQILIITNGLCARLILFLTPTSTSLQSKDPTVINNNLKRVHSEVRHVNRSAVLRHVPEPVVVPQIVTDTDHFEHSALQSKQLLSELKTPHSLNHVSPPILEPQLRSDTDHFEHQTVDADQLNEEIRHPPLLRHVSELPARVIPTDIELLHAALDAR